MRRLQSGERPAAIEPSDAAETLFVFVLHSRDSLRRRFAETTGTAMRHRPEPAPLFQNFHADFDTLVRSRSRREIPHRCDGIATAAEQPGDVLFIDPHVKNMPRAFLPAADIGPLRPVGQT